MKNKILSRTGIIASGVTSILGAIVLAYTSFLNKGTVIVNDVEGLVEAIEEAAKDDIIVIGTNGSPYRLVESMNRVGHLYIDKRIKLRGQSGRPEDVIIQGTDNRIMYLRSKGIQIADMTFLEGNCYGNSETAISPAEYRRGGGISLGLATNECTIVNCIFKKCIALNGGAIAKASGSSVDPTTQVKNCQFIENIAHQNGGGAYAIGNISGSSFRTNYAAYYGGAIANVSNVSASAFIENKSDKGGSVGYRSSIIGGGEVIQDWDGEENPKLCKICGLEQENNQCPNEGIQSHRCTLCKTPLVTLYKVCGNTSCAAYVAMTKGHLLLDSTAEGMDFKIEGIDIYTSALFHDTKLYRCKLQVGNAILVSGRSEVRNSLIYDGYNIDLIRSSTNQIDFVNCTIVSNKNYRVITSTKYLYQVAFYNCLFLGNKYTSKQRNITIKPSLSERLVGQMNSTWLYEVYPEDEDMENVYIDIINTYHTEPYKGDLWEYDGQEFTITQNREYDIIREQWEDHCISLADVYVQMSPPPPYGSSSAANIYEYDRKNTGYDWDTTPGFQGKEIDPTHPYGLRDNSTLKSKGSAYQGVLGSKDLRGYTIEKDIPLGCYLNYTPRKAIGFRISIR